MHVLNLNQNKLCRDGNTGLFTRNLTGLKFTQYTHRNKIIIVQVKKTLNRISSFTATINLASGNFSNIIFSKNSLHESFPQFFTAKLKPTSIIKLLSYECHRKYKLYFIILDNKSLWPKILFWFFYSLAYFHARKAWKSTE